MPGYKDYNNYSQQDKDSMRTDADIKSNANEQTLISQTDQVESLLGSIHADVDQVESLIAGDGESSGTHGRLDTIIANQGLILQAIDDAKTAIVNAISNQQ